MKLEQENNFQHWKLGRLLPFVLFPTKNINAEVKDGVPTGSEFACTPSGWMQTVIFLKWFDHF